MAKKDKNPLSNLSHKRRLQMIDDHYRTDYLIRGIRLAIANGLNVSIFDQITEVSKDGKTGTITKKSINSFLKEYVENCVPTYANYYLIENFDGVDYLVSDDQYEIGRRNIRNFDICGKNVGSTDDLKKFISCFTCAYIINSIIENEITPSIDDYLAQFNKDNPKPPTEWAEDNSDWVIDSGKNRISFQLGNEKIQTIKERLQFNVFLDKFDEECSRCDSGYDSIFDATLNGKAAPFKQWFDESIRSIVHYPTMPTLIRECMIKGVENYCFNNELSLYFVGNSKKTTPNDQYEEVLNELRKTMENILTLRDKLDGEHNG